MEGQVDQDHGTATVNIWVTLPGSTSQSHYLLQTSQAGSVGAADVTARQVLSALESQSWSTLYTLSAPDVTQQYTEAEYVAALSSQQHPAIVGASLTGSGSTQVIAGYTYFTQTISFSSTISGSTSTYSAVISLAWEDGQWRFIGTTAPQPAS